MKHTWIVEEVDCGMLGLEDFWICSICGACGGLATFNHSIPPSSGFYPDGSGLELSNDCVQARKQIIKHIITKTKGD